MSDNSAAPYDPESFPPPSIPLAPVLSSYTLKFAKVNQKRPSSIFSIANRRSVTSGRAAIALALEHGHVGENHEVLIPAYHCESMISPVHWRKAKPVFYQVADDTKINIDDIRRRVNQRTRAILVTHYFGFQQDLADLRKLCDEQNILLIEDCAHAFFGNRYGQMVGSSGDYAIASSMKFFPVYDGGVLASNRHSLNKLNIKRPPCKIQIKSLFNTLERAIAYFRLGIPGRIMRGVIKLKDLGWKLTKSTGRVDITSGGPASSEGGYGLDENWIHKRATWVSRKIISFSDLDRIAQLRRQNYLKLDNALRGLPGARPLFNELPDDCVPLVYPMYFDNPAHHFIHLKKLGVPIWRFGEYLDSNVDPEEFAISSELSRHIFQFPCHQELKDDEMDWMINEISTSLKNRDNI